MQVRVGLKSTYSLTKQVFCISLMVEMSDLQNSDKNPNDLSKLITPTEKVNRLRINYLLESANGRGNLNGFDDENTEIKTANPFPSGAVSILAPDYYSQIEELRESGNRKNPRNPVDNNENNETEINQSSILNQDFEEGFTFPKIRTGIASFQSSIKPKVLAGEDLTGELGIKFFGEGDKKPELEMVSELKSEVENKIFPVLQLEPARLESAGALEKNDDSNKKNSIENVKSYINNALLDTMGEFGNVKIYPKNNTVFKKPNTYFQFNQINLGKLASVFAIFLFFITVFNIQAVKFDPGNKNEIAAINSTNLENNSVLGGGDKKGETANSGKKSVWENITGFFSGGNNAGNKPVATSTTYIPDVKTVQNNQNIQAGNGIFSQYELPVTGPQINQVRSSENSSIKETEKLPFPDFSGLFKAANNPIPIEESGKYLKSPFKTVAENSLPNGNLPGNPNITSVKGDLLVRSGIKKNVYSNVFPVGAKITITLENKKISAPITVSGPTLMDNGVVLIIDKDYLTELFPAKFETGDLLKNTIVKAV